MVEPLEEVVGSLLVELHSTNNFRYFRREILAL